MEEEEEEEEEGGKRGKKKFQRSLFWQVDYESWSTLTTLLFSTRKKELKEGGVSCAAP